MSSRIFLQPFSPDLLERFCDIQSILIEDEKDGNHFVHGLVNMVDPRFFLRDSC